MALSSLMSSIAVFGPEAIVTMHYYSAKIICALRGVATHAPVSDGVDALDVDPWIQSLASWCSATVA